jgi:branched-subunit amino acid aminotransferase/4-amino-4-deoxychorismate lyase
MTTNNYYHYLNGKIINDTELLISPRDIGFTRGYSVFEYFRTYYGKPFKLDNYIERLLISAELIGLVHSYSMEQIKEIVFQLLNLNDDGNEKILKIFLSGGVSDSMSQSSAPTFIIIVDVYKPKLQSYYETGVNMGLTKFVRYMPKAKSTNYIEGIRALKQKKKLNIYETIYYSDVQVYEGSNCNVFAVKNGEIYTPKDSILLGITREVLISDLKDKIKIKELNFNLNFLLSADEVFISSSGKGVIPVVKIEETIIGNGEVGSITKLVMKEFIEFVSRIK